MARTEEQMNEEMSGMAAPTGDMPMEEPMEAPETAFDMETVMGNFMDLDDDRRQIATRLIASPAAVVLDEILGEPIIARLAEQLGQTIEMTAEEIGVSEAPTDSPAEGIMGAPAPTEEKATAPLV